MNKKIELLAPAKNAETGIIAIKYGADAVYIGADFSARADAFNSINEIETLVKYAHQYNAKVFLALNTLLLDSEVEKAAKIAFSAYNIGVDAIIIQDLGLIEYGLPPIPIHASTQMHNYSIERIKFLEEIGISRVILPRELSLENIKQIKEQTNIELESFIHGALCVSYSGQCYMSSYIGKRSANRGCCAQPCRLQYDVLDNDKNIILENKYILSLKDLKLDNYIDKIIDSGIVSLKIEGRLKSLNYVANIVAYYRQLLDNIFEKNNNYKKASSGKVIYDFTPNPYKTFNRGYTELNINERNTEIASVNTPKSTGELLGEISEIGKNFIVIDTNNEIFNGDGLCFYDKKNNLDGFFINKVEGNKVFFEKTMPFFIGQEIYRNKDIEFEKKISISKTNRFVDIDIEISFDKTLKIKAIDEDNIDIVIEKDDVFELAEDNEKAIQNIKEQISKTGNTIFKVRDIKIISEKLPYLKKSVANDIRRELLELLLNKRLELLKPKASAEKLKYAKYPESEATAKNNILNKSAKSFYEKCEVNVTEFSPEHRNKHNLPLMTSHYCINYQLGVCSILQDKVKTDIPQPKYIRNRGRLFRLEFDCSKCEMLIFAE